jgi:diaminopimelate decarboxylase
MTNFAYHHGQLHVDALPLSQLAASIETPFYCYSAGRLRDNYQRLQSALAEFQPLICFAVKANANQAVLSTLADCGAGADIVSGGELERALAATIVPGKIVYSGVGKSAAEMRAALLAGIHQFNVESLPELRLLNLTAAELNTIAPVALRVNPDVDPLTHAKISTGEEDTKFGIPREQISEALTMCRQLPNLALKGLSVHIGSQLTDFEPFRQAYRFVADLVRHCRAEGHSITRLDLGGGIGIPYQGQPVPPLSLYADIVRETVGALGCQLAFEPGRYLCADAGVLVTRVLTVKQTPEKNFLVLDAGMNDLVRPAMYEARHTILPVQQTQKPLENYAVVGPICETSDLFGEDYRLPQVAEGDLMAIMDAGAYGSSMAGTYNAKPLVPEVLAQGSNFAVVRRRITVAEQIAWESVPEWLASRAAA